MRVVLHGTSTHHRLLTASSPVLSNIQPGDYKSSVTDEVESLDVPFVHASSKTNLTGLLMNRRFTEDELNKEFDVIVIGGGINGCGIARDASGRGLKVLLLEKEDFGAGCTSVSTRLIHGGLRYLEHFEFGLVRESLTEREILLKNASHLVHPLELCIPIYEDSKRGYWLIKAGMLLYDLLSLNKSLPKHRMMSKEEFVKYESGIKEEGLVGAAVYYDAQCSYPERICLENALIAKSSGAIVLNHTEVVKFDIGRDTISSLKFVDALTGKEHTVRGKIIVNASGPWVDSLCGLADKSIERKIGGTKGSHLIVKQFEGGPKHAIYASAKSDGRPFFIIPWQGYYLIGTTDIPYSGDLDKLKVGDDEVNYLICETNNVLKNRSIGHDDILYTYCGVRPLPFVSDKDPGKITRCHVINDHKKIDGLDNFISVIGGKLTTYRNLSELVVDLCFKKLSISFVPATTSVTPLIGNIEGSVSEYKKNQAKKILRKYDLDFEITSHLIDLYGSRFKEVLGLTLKDQELRKLLSSHSLDIRAQIKYAIENEWAFTLTDVLLRRLSCGLSEGLGEDVAYEVSKYLKILLNLSDEEISRQVKEYEDKVIKLRKT